MRILSNKKATPRAKLTQQAIILIAFILVVIVGIFFWVRQDKIENTPIRVKLLKIEDYGINKPTSLHEGKLTFQDTIDGKTHTYNLCTSDTDWNNTVFVNAFYDMPYNYFAPSEQSKNPATLGCSGSIYPSDKQ